MARHRASRTARDRVRGCEDVVGVQKPDDIAGGAIKTFVHGIVDAFVALRDEIGDAGSVGPKALERAVGGFAVDDDILDVRVALGDHR